MRPESSSTLHILIVDGKLGNARLLRGILLELGIKQVKIAEDTDSALAEMAVHAYQAVFCDEAAGPMPLARFAQAIRRRREIRNPRVPIVLISAGPQRADVEAARDAGVNDLIVRPLSVAAVKRKLLGLVSAPKPFVEAKTFLGPDRRRHREGPAVRERRRSSDTN